MRKKCFSPAGVRTRFTADEAYGDNPGLRDWLDEQDINYVMAISCDARFPTPTGPRRADELAACAPKRGWQRLSCGKGSKGHRLYDWLLIDPGADDHLLLVRRSISKPANWPITSAAAAPQSRSPS